MPHVLAQHHVKMVKITGKSRVFPYMRLSSLVCYYSNEFSSNGNDKFPHIALARAQDDSKGLR